MAFRGRIIDPLWKRIIVKTRAFFCPYPLYSFKWWASLLGIFILVLGCVSIYLRMKPIDIDAISPAPTTSFTSLFPYNTSKTNSIN